MYVHGCTWLQNKSTILRKSLNSPQSHEVTHLEPLFPKHLRDFKRPRGLPRSLPDRPCRHGTALVAAGRSQRLHGLRVDGALHGPPHLVERTAQLWTAIEGDFEDTASRKNEREAFAGDAYHRAPRRRSPRTAVER